jgi:CubicO group peptidase (beta-lactamase class C family)
LARLPLTKLLRRVGAGLLVLLLAALGSALLLYPPTYVWRVLVWQNADVEDQFRFAQRTVKAASRASELPVVLDEAAVRQAFVAALPGQALESWLQAQGTLGFVVLRHGQLIYEGYFNGQQRDDPATSFSVAKSVLGTLLDQAIEAGKVSSLDDPVTRYLPELQQRDPRFEAVTLRHLVDMNAGLHYQEFPFLNGDDAKTYYWPDLRELALQHTQVEQAPGQAWLYNNYHPLLIGLVLERRTGMPVAQWLQQQLWQPAGMPAGASWSLDHEGGFEKLESGINARTRDFARFGQLLLDQGVALDGRRVLSAAAVRAATSPEGAMPLTHLRPGMYYKHFWWGQQRADGGHDFSARGNFGQFVFVSPANGVVIARNGERYGVPPGQWLRLFEQMADRLGAKPAS